MTVRVALLVVFLAACDPPAPAHTVATTPVTPAAYDASSRWICQPGAAFDACKTELPATELEPNGTRTLLEDRRPAHTKVDCFYVYPTVDMDMTPGNHEDLDDTTKQTRTTLAQVGRFSEVCSVWAPLYRQVTFGTYMHGKDRLEEGLGEAYADVSAAFREYLSRVDPQRKVVVVGHSQGAQMVLRLLKEFFDGDAAMRARLLLAMPIGTGVDVPPGQTTGGTFASIPICTKPNEVGCIVTYRSYAAGHVDPLPGWLPPAGQESACVNPASVDGGDGRFSRAILTLGPMRRFLRGVDDVTTSYVAIPDFYAGRCVKLASGFSYLEVSAAPRPGDARESPVDLDRRMLFPRMGLHILDMQLEQGDLVAMIARRAAALP